ncbi:MAG: hypothetical protein RRC07_16345 [Anaerolineae bacterium]|nr:hypothetical protein [Anaerolineae bacterium]
MNADERREILDLVAAGKLSPEQASLLLQGEPATVSALAGAAEQAEQVIPVEEDEVEMVKQEEKGEPRGRWLHIHVNDLKSGDRRVSVNVPLGLLRAGLALGGQVSPELRRFSWDDLSAALIDEQGGLIVEVKDEEDGEHVQIFVD